MLGWLEKLLSKNSISAQELKSALSSGKWLLIDVREQDEWNEGHISGARHIPLDQINSKIKEIKEQSVGKNIAVICHSGGRSAQGCSLLSKNGLENVFNVSGGMISWEQIQSTN